MAIRLNKITTRTGDDGSTALVGGRRVSKGDLKIEAYGSVDELNSFLGLMRACADGAAQEYPAVNEQTQAVFKPIQNDLFHIGSILATPAGETFEGMSEITAQQIEYLEKHLGHFQKDLEELTSFVLPGGGLVSSYAHVARTVCRRVERILVRLAEVEAVAPEIVVYLNRLSDLLFNFARWAAKQCGRPETLWER